MLDEAAEQELREAVEARLVTRLEEIRSRREGRRRRLAELSERREAGLRARHRHKLNRAAGEDRT